MRDNIALKTMTPKNAAANLAQHGIYCRPAVDGAGRWLARFGDMSADVSGRDLIAACEAIDPVSVLFTRVR